MIQAVLFLILFVVGITAVCGADRMTSFVEDDTCRPFVVQGFFVSVMILLLIGGLVGAFIGLVGFGAEVWSYVTVAGL